MGNYKIQDKRTVNLCFVVFLLMCLKIFKTPTRSAIFWQYFKYNVGFLSNRYKRPFLLHLDILFPATTSNITGLAKKLSNSNKYKIRVAACKSIMKSYFFVVGTSNAFWSVYWIAWITLLGMAEPFGKLWISCVFTLFLTFKKWQQ